MQIATRTLKRVQWDSSYWIESYAYQIGNFSNYDQRYSTQ